MLRGSCSFIILVSPLHAHIFITLWVLLGNVLGAVGAGMLKLKVIVASFGIAGSLQNRLHILLSTRRHSGLDLTKARRSPQPQTAMKREYNAQSIL